MTDPRAELVRLVNLAHERELKDILLSLFGRFDQWRRGQLDPFALNDDLRRHVNETSRRLQAKYTGPPENAVAMAIIGGVLREDELDAQSARIVAPILQYLRDKTRG